MSQSLKYSHILVISLAYSLPQAEMYVNKYAIAFGERILKSFLTSGTDCAS